LHLWELRHVEGLYVRKKPMFFFRSCREIGGSESEAAGAAWFGASPQKAAASGDCCSLPKIIIIFSNPNFDLKPSSNFLLTSQDPVMSILSTSARVSSVRPTKCGNYNLNLHIWRFSPAAIGACDEWSWESAHFIPLHSSFSIYMSAMYSRMPHWSK
jgi:hypothetical protein